MTRDAANTPMVLDVFRVLIDMRLTLYEEHSGSSHSHSVSHPHRGHSHGGGHSHSHDSPQDGSSRTDKGRGGKRRYKPTEHDMEKLRSTLKQLVRDWSEEVYDSSRENRYPRLILTAHAGKSGAGRLLRAH